MSGVRGSPGDGLERRIVDEKMGIADFNMRKIVIFDHQRIIKGASWDHLETMMSDYNAFTMHLD